MLCMLGEYEIGGSSKYTQDNIDAVLKAVSEGKGGLKRAVDALRAKSTEFPSYATVRNWRRVYSEFEDKYQMARLEQIENLVEEIVEIADDDSNDYIFSDDGEKRIINNEAISRSKLRVNTRQWLASKLLQAYKDPKKEDGDEGPSNADLLRELE